MAVFGSRKRIRLAGIVAMVAMVTALSCVLNDGIGWIGFSANDRYLATATRSGVLTIYDLGKGTSREVTQEAAPGGFAWSPAGNLLAFCLRGKGGWNLALAHSTGTVTLLTHDEWRNLQPVWSSDGQNIYYASSEGGGYHGDYDIRYYDLATRRSFPIIRGPHDQVEPRISPDGRWLAAVSYEQGNPLLVIYAVKTTRVIRIPPPPAYRGERLRLLLWLGDSRRLLYEIEQGRRYHLIECEVESEKAEKRDESDHPFESVSLDRSGRDLLYVSGGKAWRRSTQPFWGRRRRLAFDGLPVGRVAARHRDDQLAAVVAEELLALASASGGKVQPLVKDNKEYLRWGDLELERGYKRQGLKYYDAAMAAVRAEYGQADAEREIAKIKLSRAALLCRSGYSRETAEYLRDAQRVLGRAMDRSELDQLYSTFAFNEFVWNGREEAARALAEKIPPKDRWDGTELLLRVLSHPDKEVHKEFRRGLAALWQGKIENGLEIFLRLYQSHPKDPVVLALFHKAWDQKFDLPDGGIFTPWAAIEKQMAAWARAVVRHHEAVGEYLLDGEWRENLKVASTIVQDPKTWKRIILRFDRKLLTAKEIQDSYGGYWRMEEDEEVESHPLYDAFVRVYFDPEVLARATALTADPLVLADIRLARARYALVTGDVDELKRALGEVTQDLSRLGIKTLFGSDPVKKIVFDILQGELNERTGAWSEAVADYRKAAADLEPLWKEKKEIGTRPKTLARFCEQARFRAGLLEQGAKAKAEIADLVAIERGVGDHLMTDASDPTSLLNGIHSYFALLAQMTTPWVRDVVYLKAGQSYRRLGRWCEAGYCLRIAAQSRERFVARCARAELSDLYRDLGDPGLANWYSPQQ